MIRMTRVFVKCTRYFLCASASLVLPFLLLAYLRGLWTVDEMFWPIAERGHSMESFCGMSLVATLLLSFTAVC